MVSRGSGRHAEFQNPPADSQVNILTLAQRGQLVPFQLRQQGGHGVGAELGRRLRARGNRCVTVRRGEAFSLSADAGTVDPRDPDQYRRLLAEVGAAGSPLHGIVHAWCLDRVHTPDEGAADWTLLDFAMRYHDRYAREAGQWKFADRQLEVVWVETRKVGPFSPAMMGRDLRGF